MVFRSFTKTLHCAGGYILTETLTFGSKNVLKIVRMSLDSWSPKKTEFPYINHRLCFLIQVEELAHLSIILKLCDDLYLNRMKDKD